MWNFCDTNMTSYKFTFLALIVYFATHSWPPRKQWSLFWSLHSKSISANERNTRRHESVCIKYAYNSRARSSATAISKINNNFLTDNSIVLKLHRKLLCTSMNNFLTGSFLSLKIRPISKAIEYKNLLIFKCIGNKFICCVRIFWFKITEKCVSKSIFII